MHNPGHPTGWQSSHFATQSCENGIDLPSGDVTLTQTNVQAEPTQ